MSYQQLIMCVDNSGSMSGSKIRDSIKYLNEIASEFGCKTIYFRFGCKVEKISAFNESQLPCNDGTRIQDCLNDLYSNQLRRFTGSKTKFIFVTDAEDQIKDVSGVKSVKRQCESAFGNNLHSYCLRVGASRGCSSELEQIFGSNAFDHVHQGKFRTILKKITGNVKKAQKLEKETGTVKAKTTKMKQDNKKVREEFDQTVKLIQNLVSSAQTKTRQAQRELATAKTNIEDLDREKPTVTTQAREACTEVEVDVAEARVETQLAGYVQEERRIDTADKRLDVAKGELKTGSERANNIAKKLQENTQKLGEKAERVIADILECIKQLEQIQEGCYDQVAELRTKFRSSLNDLMDLVKENDELQDEMKHAQQNITGALKDYKRQRVDLSQMKETVLNNIQELNRLLEELDRRC